MNRGTLELVEACLLNDEASTDEELAQYFVTEFEMKPVEADYYVAQRDRALSERLAHFTVKPYSAVEEMLRQLARCTKDGECSTCGQDGFEDNPECDDHEPWDMPNDDAVDTLHDFIDIARGLVEEMDKEVKG